MSQILCIPQLLHFDPGLRLLDFDAPKACCAQSIAYDLVGHLKTYQYVCIRIPHACLLFIVCCFLFVCDKVSKQTGSGWWFGELQTRGKARQTGWFPADHVDLLQKKANVANTTPPPPSSGQPSSGQQQPTGVAGGATGGVLGTQRARSVSCFLTLFFPFCVINRRKMFLSVSYISLTLCSHDYAASISPLSPDSR